MAQITQNEFSKNEDNEKISYERKKIMKNTKFQTNKMPMTQRKESRMPIYTSAERLLSQKRREPITRIRTNKKGRSRIKSSAVEKGIHAPRSASSLRGWWLTVWLNQSEKAGLLVKQK